MGQRAWLRSPGHSSARASRLSSPPAGRRTAATVATSTIATLALVLGLLPLAASASADPWAPSTWTGVLAGAPVPGTGLPAAVAPGPPASASAGLDLAARLEEQTTCDPVVKPGTQALANLIRATYPGASIGLLRNCSIGDTSEHKDGRALDWMVSVRNPQERANAEAFLNWLLAPDATGTPYANARRLGVMYLGWHDRIWRAYDVDRGWSELKGCFAKPAPASDTLCHRNHIHISLSWDGAAGLTSFWDGTPIDGPACKAAAADGSAKFAGVTPVGDRIAIPPVRVLDTRAGLGVPARCRVASGPKASTRVSAKVLGVGGVPTTGVTGAVVRVSVLTPNAPAQISAWSSGQPSPQVVANATIATDVAGEAVVPVASDGSIGIVISQGDADLVVEVLGYVTGSTADWTPVPAAVVPAAASTAAVPAPPAPSSPAPPAQPAPSTQPEPAQPTPEPEPALYGLVSVGSQLGYASEADRRLHAGEHRSLPIAGLPAQAAHAVVLLTTQRAKARGALRLGPRSARTRMSFPSSGQRSALLVVPVTEGTLAVSATKRSGVSLRVDLLGYSAQEVPALTRIRPLRVADTRLDAGVTQQVTVAKVGRLPGRKHLTAVVLRVLTSKAKAAGAVRVVSSPSGGPVPQAPVAAGHRTATILLAPVADDGTITLTSDVPATARVQVIGFVR